jgi:MoxR-like ATPase
VRPFKPEVCPLQEKFVTTRKELSAALIERDGEVDLILTALIAQENVLLVGPPGCAKSLLLDSLMRWLCGQRFSILLNRFTTPEELLGPISVTSLKSDVYRRVTTGKLPESDLAFLDEVFKASSAILNTILKLLNERTYEVGDGTTAKVPLKLAVAASNEWPSPETGKELAALFDRFVLRKSVRPILTMAGRKRLLWERDHTPTLSTSITPAEVDRAHAEALLLPWTDQAREATEVILRELSREGIQPGDRRQFKAISVAQAFAWLCGADQVEVTLELDGNASALLIDGNHRLRKLAALGVLDAPVYLLNKELTEAVIALGPEGPRSELGRMIQQEQGDRWFKC